MQLMRPADVPKTGRDKLYRYSPANAVVGVCLLLAFCMWLILFGRQKHLSLPYYISSGGLLLIVLAYQRIVLARFRPSNWLVRMTDNCLYVQFRSYLNYHFGAEDPTVVSIPYPEIRSVRLVRVAEHVPDYRHTRQTKIRRIVELEMSVDLARLEQALSSERTRQGPKRARWYGSSSTKYQHYPANVVSGALQLEWGVVPNSRVFASDLRKHIALAPPPSLSQEKEYLHLDRLSRDMQEEKLLELAERGGIIAAITIARELYSFDLAAAKAFIEGLISDKAGKQGVNERAK